ncbi:DUF3397 family protein [Ureibacillus sp. MALMAid1270]|uniref:DUF3397 family protein n=1 Tax=Ureibacillus sp. MALMAid1270 TaxID=3411629 RepID=UPI003BA8387A
MSILLYVISFIILFPIILFAVIYFICRKGKVSKVKSFGFASDVTTFVLFLSVPLIINSLWEVKLGVYVICIAILIAIIFTYIEWKTKKEIEIIALLKKIWRVLFLILIILYILLWIVGIVYKIITYIFYS